LAKVVVIFLFRLSMWFAGLFPLLIGGGKFDNSLPAGSRTSHARATKPRGCESASEASRRKESQVIPVNFTPHPGVAVIGADVNFHREH